MFHFCALLFYNLYLWCTQVMTKLGHKDAIVLFRPKTLQNKFEPSEVIYEGADPVDKWVKANYHGICGVSRLIQP